MKELKWLLALAILATACSEAVEKHALIPQPTPYPTPVAKPQPVAICPGLEPADGTRIVLTRLKPSSVVKVCTDDWSGVPTDPVNKALDLFVSIDTTSSMGGSIESLRKGVDQLGKEVAKLSSDATYGLSEFKDWSLDLKGKGDAGDFPFRLNQSLSADLGAFAKAVSTLKATGGGDGPESALEALFQTATGAGDDGFSKTYYNPAIPKQEMGWRPLSSKIIVLITDAGFSPPPALRKLTRDDVKAALTAKGIKVIGINVGAGIDSRDELVDFAKATGAVAEEDLDFDLNGKIEPAKNEFKKGDPLVFTYRSGDSGGFNNIAAIITKGISAIIGHNVDVDILGDQTGLQITNLDGPKTLRKGDYVCFRMEFLMRPDFMTDLRCAVQIDRDIALQTRTNAKIVLGKAQAPLELQPGP